MKALHVLATILVIIGAINWGLVGLFDLDLVAKIFGSMTTAARAVYVIIGIAGVCKLFCWSYWCHCKKDIA